jgi:predicted dehydrogenase
MLDESPVDAVLVCTPEDRHAAPALAALAAGKHVLVEKPLAEKSSDGAAMVRAAAACPGLVCMTAHSLRFDPRYTILRDAAASGRLGDIVHITARRTPPLAALNRVGGRAELPFWVGVHDIDMMRWVASSEVSRVAAVASDKGLETRGLKRAILSTLMFRTGVIAALDNSWGPDTDSPGQQSTAEFRVQGTRGFAAVQSHEHGVHVHSHGDVYTPDALYMPEVHGRIAGTYRNQLEHFVECIRRGAPAAVSFADGYRAVAVAEAILESARRGEAVKLNEQFE